MLPDLPAAPVLGREIDVVLESLTVPRDRAPIHRFAWRYARRTIQFHGIPL
jgi:hypothetical protein